MPPRADSPARVEGVDLGVRRAGAAVVAHADDDSGGVRDDAADAGVGVGLGAEQGGVERPLHQRGVAAPWGLPSCLEPVGRSGSGLMAYRRTHLEGAPVVDGRRRDPRVPPARAASHPDFHRRSRISTWSTGRWLRPGRGLSPPARNCTDPGARTRPVCATPARENSLRPLCDPSRPAGGSALDDQPHRPEDPRGRDRVDPQPPDPVLPRVDRVARRADEARPPAGRCPRRSRPRGRTRAARPCGGRRRRGRPPAASSPRSATRHPRPRGRTRGRGGSARSPTGASRGGPGGPDPTPPRAPCSRRSGSR